MNDSKQIRRGDIYWADIRGSIGSEQGGKRPVLIWQNDVGNKFSPTTIVLVLTSKKAKPKLPTHVSVLAEESGIEFDSVVLCEQVKTIDKSRLGKRIGALNFSKMKEVEKAFLISCGIQLSA